LNNVYKFMICKNMQKLIALYFRLKMKDMKFHNQNLAIQTFYEFFKLLFKLIGHDN
jgi:hypothetical protein